MALFGWLSRKASWISDAEFELERVRKLIQSADYREKFVPQFRMRYGQLADSYSGLQVKGEAVREKVEKLAATAKARAKSSAKGDKASEDAHGLAANWALLKMIELDDSQENAIKATIARTKYDNFIIEQFGTLHPPTHDPLFD